MTSTVNFSSRLATPDDLPALGELMDASIRGLIPAFLDAARVDASFEIMGLDRQLIDDGTYFVVESGASSCLSAKPLLRTKGFTLSR